MMKFTSSVLLLSLTVVNAQTDIPASAIAAPITNRVGRGLTAVFTNFDIPAITSFADVEGAPIRQQFCSRVQQINFYDAVGGGDPLDAYVRNNNFELYSDQIGVAMPQIQQAELFSPAGSFFDNTDADRFTADFFGYINILNTGTYTFSLGHDDGAQLFIGNELVIDQGVNTGYRVDSNTATFTRTGLYPIVVRSFDDEFQAGIVLFYEVPDSTNRIVVPQDVLFPTRDCYGEVFNNDGPIAAGDPHFKTWSGEKYSFHGACDLVLLHSDQFDGEGLDIHIRTKHRRFFSYITSAVVRIGNEIFEVTGNKRKAYFLNGVESVDMPATISGHGIVHEHSDDKKTQTFTIDIGDGESIIIKTWSDFVSVAIDNGSEDRFGDSVGLMGNFQDGLMLARDGKTVISNTDEFGQEWMLRRDEENLFQKVKSRGEKCAMPAVTSEKRRRLGEAEVTEEMAKQACAKVARDEMEFCIYDVMATSDMDSAGAY